MWMLLPGGGLSPPPVMHRLPAVALAAYYNVCKQRADNHLCHLLLPLAWKQPVCVY